MSINTWKNRWESELIKSIDEKGYSSIKSFMMENSNSTFSDLANMLGKNVAPIQVIHIFMNECDKNNDMDFFILDSLVRNLIEYIPLGWGKGELFEKKLSLAISRWIAALPKEYEKKAWKAWEELKSSDLERGWLPLDTKDSVLTSLLHRK